MSNISQAGARDRGHQVGCPAMREAGAECSCPRARRAPEEIYPGFIEGFDPNERAPWWIWAIAWGAVALSVLCIMWVTGVIPGAYPP